jgi:hypothetical protein
MTTAGAIRTTAGVEDAEKRQALSRLQELYREARELVSSAESYANLDWILGARRNPKQRPADFDDKTIQLVALWLQDLALEVDRGLAPHLDGEFSKNTLLAHRARHCVATSLRAAAEGFLVAFRPLAMTP